jgi:predicted AlkP superfamily pyrophosphatase or phosphodiesterase
MTLGNVEAVIQSQVQREQRFELVDLIIDLQFWQVFAQISLIHTLLLSRTHSDSASDSLHAQMFFARAILLADNCIFTELHVLGVKILPTFLFISALPGWFGRLRAVLARFSSPLRCISPCACYA